MVVDFLLWGNIVVCGLSGVAIGFSRPRTISMALFVFGLFSLSVLTFFDRQIVASPEQLILWKKYSIICESLTVLFFYFYTKTSFRDNSEIYKGLGFWISSILGISILLFAMFAQVETLFFSPDFSVEKVLFLNNQGFSFYLVLMAYLVFGLVQLERSLVALHPLQRWNVKLEVLGSGLLLASLALYFSQSLLYRTIDIGFLGIRSAAIIIAVLLVFYSRISRNRNSQFSLSRGIAHRSFVLLVVGSYLIILGVIGEGLRYLDVDSAKEVLYILILLGSLGLAAVFLSESLRRKIRVILHKNLYRSKYDYREQWFRFSEKVVSKSSLKDIESSILELFCETLACKWASLYLFDFEKNKYQLTASFQTSHNFPSFAVKDPLVFQLKKAERIVNLHDKAFISAESSLSSFQDVRSFLAVPLFFDEDLVGFVLLGEQINAEEELTYEDYDLLRMFARQSVGLIHGLRLNDELSITRELAAIGKVSTFVLHDLKNQVSGLSLMLDNAREYISDPDFQQDMLETVDNTVVNLRGLIARLKTLKENPELFIVPVELGKIVNDAVSAAGGNIKVLGESVRINADAEAICRVVLNLLLNAIEATEGNGLVKVEFGCEGGFAYVDVTDDGCGMSENFIKTQLFKPFSTTKKQGLGIGLYQCQQVIESHSGTIKVSSQEGHGTTFSIRLPLTPEFD